VGVFVNEAHDVALATLRRYGIRIVQLHGDESPEECSTFRTEGYVVIKAIGVSAAADITAAARYRGCVDMLLFDTKSSGHGGTGRKFDHAILDDYPLDIPYLLSGGIAPGDAAKIASHLYPGMVGIDINSRFESAPGIKDIALLTNFIINLRKYNEYEPSRIPFWEQAK
jgi:phosphoribosylanthranilate isomerase